ncbi:MAG: large subunit ribosomal protein [Candidatus Dependentiae bacterium]|nr:large subunit ribosomal protein [Candidatus Dependentiae bacterium]
MKKNLHPTVNHITAACACGQSYQIATTLAEASFDICSNCHPFFTGQQKFIDRAGRIEKFQRRFDNKTATK